MINKSCRERSESIKEAVAEVKAHQNEPLKDKLNAYLKQKDYEMGMYEGIHTFESSGNIVLPNCLFFSEPGFPKTARAMQYRPEMLQIQEPKGLLSENVVKRSERWIQQRDQKIESLKKEEYSKSLYGCTFFPTFYTKTKQLF